MALFCPIIPFISLDRPLLWSSQVLSQLPSSFPPIFYWFPVRVLFPFSSSHICNPFEGLDHHWWFYDVSPWSPQCWIDILYNHFITIFEYWRKESIYQLLIFVNGLLESKCLIPLIKIPWKCFLLWVSLTYSSPLIKGLGDRKNLCGFMLCYFWIWAISVFISSLHFFITMSFLNLIRFFFFMKLPCSNLARL